MQRHKERSPHAPDSQCGLYAVCLGQKTARGAVRGRRRQGRHAACDTRRAARVKREGCGGGGGTPTKHFEQ